MAQAYKTDKQGNILNEAGEVVLTVLAGKCSQKFKMKAAKLLANALFNVERGEESRNQKGK